MKLICIVFSLMIFTNFFSQDLKLEKVNTINEKNKNLKNKNSKNKNTTGRFIIDPYIGVVNWISSYYYQYNEPDFQNYNYKKIGIGLSQGGRFEYMITDKLGIGADINYEVSGFTYDYFDYQHDGFGNYVFDVNGNLLQTIYTDQYKLKQLRAMFRQNIHYFQSDKVDVYSAFGVGCQMAADLKTTSPNNPFSKNNSFYRWMFSVRLATGTRIYFTQNIGAHVELGVFGGALIQYGLTAKF